MAVAPESVRLLEHQEDLDALADLDAPGRPSRCWPRRRSATTSGGASWRGPARRFPDLWMPNRSDLCFATTNRQAALKAIASEADAVVVIGSANSSNTVALEKVARAGGCPPSCASTRPTSSPTTLPGPSASPPAPRPPRPSSRRSSGAWPPPRA